MTEVFHVPVLLEAVIKYAVPENGKIFADATFGLGGHTRAVLEHYPQLEKVIATDRDYEILSFARQNLKDERIHIAQANASELFNVLKELGIKGVDGILLDLGVSSYQLENPKRGFSFLRDGPLDMRMNTNEGPTAADIINTMPEKELARIFKEYGEEKFSFKIAEAIAKRRVKKPFTTTGELAKTVEAVVCKKSAAHYKIHPATRVFQAVRIAVNNELDELKAFLESALDCLNVNGRLTIISFHSLEDKIVKSFMQTISQGCTCPKEFPVCVCGKKPKAEILTKKAIFASEEEIKLNPRSRSARLRSCKKICRGE